MRKIGKKLKLEKLKVYDKIWHFTYPWASIKDFQATEKAFSPHNIG
jgi:hypothetical protein